MEKYYKNHKINRVFFILLLVLFFLVISFFSIYKMNTKVIQTVLLPSPTSLPKLKNPKTIENRKKFHICTELDIDERYLWGEWELPMITAEGKPRNPIFPGLITIKKDGSFTLKGYSIAPDYIFNGKWSFDKKQLKIKLEYTDNIDHHNESIRTHNELVLKYSNQEFVNERNKVQFSAPSDEKNKYPYQLSKILLDGFSPQGSCYMYIKIGGWNFTHVVTAEEILSEEDLKQYRKLMEGK